jgi:hypothetical protein
MAGASPRTIMELAGHADIQTTMRSMHVHNSATRTAVDLLEAFDADPSGTHRSRHDGGTDRGTITKKPARVV